MDNILLVIKRKYQNPPSSAWLSLLVAVILALIAYFFIDQALFQYNKIAWVGLKPLAHQTTDLAKGIYWILLSLFLLLLSRWWRKWRAFSINLCIAVVGSGVAVNIIKYLVGRARPHTQNLDSLNIPTNEFRWTWFDNNFASFPSGHSATVLAVWMVLFLAWRKGAILVMPLAIWLLGTRFLIEAHYLSDIIMGGALGVFFALWGHKWLEPADMR